MVSSLLESVYNDSQNTVCCSALWLFLTANEYKCLSTLKYLKCNENHRYFLEGKGKAFDRTLLLLSGLFRKDHSFIAPNDERK